MDTIKQRRIVVPTEGGDVTVRRMKWKAAREFMLALAAQIRSVGLIGRVGIETLLEKVSELVAGTESLVNQLLTSTTSLTPEQIDDLDLLELAEVIRAAMELNLGDELKNCWTGIGQKIAALVGGEVVEGDAGAAKTPTPSSGGSMPTSSMPDIAPSISRPAPSST